MQLNETRAQLDHHGHILRNGRALTPLQRNTKIATHIAQIVVARAARLLALRPGLVRLIVAAGHEVLEALGHLAHPLAVGGVVAPWRGVVVRRVGHVQRWIIAI